MSQQDWMFLPRKERVESSFKEPRAEVEPVHRICPKFYSGTKPLNRPSPTLTSREMQSTHFSD